MKNGRRQFLGRLAASAFAFSILPPASYARVWKAVKPPLFTKAEFEQFIVDAPPCFDPLILTDALTGFRNILQVDAAGNLMAIPVRL